MDKEDDGGPLTDLTYKEAINFKNGRGSILQNDHKM